MQYEPVLGAKGVALTEKMIESIKEQTGEWDHNTAEIIQKTILQEAVVAAAEQGISTEDPGFQHFRKQVELKYDNEEQISILRSAYVSQGAIKMLRDVLRPIIIRRTGDSVDNNGQPILGLPPVQTLTAYSPMRAAEHETQQEINEEHRQSKPVRWAFCFFLSDILMSNGLCMLETPHVMS